MRARERPPSAEGHVAQLCRLPASSPRCYAGTASCTHPAVQFTLIPRLLRRAVDNHGLAAKQRELVRFDCIVVEERLRARGYSLSASLRMQPRAGPRRDSTHRVRRAVHARSICVGVASVPRPAVRARRRRLQTRCGVRRGPSLRASQLRVSSPLKLPGKISIFRLEPQLNVLHQRPTAL